MCAINMRDCTEELLKFVFNSHINGTLEIDLGLSKDFCSRLLQPDPSEPFPTPYSYDSFEGVPPYPLYKCLASALHETTMSKTFRGACNRIEMFGVDNSLAQKEHEWQRLISEKGSQIGNILKTINFELDVQEPFFSQLKDGLKTIEGRCAVGKCNRIESGSWILFNKFVVFEVQDVRKHASFSNMLEAEGLRKVFPGVESINEGMKIYRKIYTDEKEKSNGVLAICVSKAAHQPLNCLASLLYELGYGGLQGLLGLKHTKGTIKFSLPPPRSILLSSFMSPYKFNVRPVSWFEAYQISELLNEGSIVGVNSGRYVNVSGLRSYRTQKLRQPDNNLWEVNRYTNVSGLVSYRTPKLVKGSRLTHGARALAKHAHRSSNNYWGSLDGNDSEKNRIALETINRLLTHCCWLNVHIVPPHGDVFEIRVANGYGARWSKDGIKFIGFLEPYMEDGHSIRWKH